VFVRLLQSCISDNRLPNQSSVSQPATNAPHLSSSHQSSFCRQASLPYAPAVDDELISSADGTMSTRRQSSEAEYDCGYNEFTNYIESHPDHFTDERNDINLVNANCSRPHQLHLSNSSPNEEDVLVATSSSPPEYSSRASDVMTNQYHGDGHVSSSVHDGRSRILSSVEEQGYNK
jgi:hypothetical protein